MNWFIPLVAAAIGCTAQNIDFPDPALKDRLISYPVASLSGGNPNQFNASPDANHDGEISMAEAAAVFGLDLSSAPGLPTIHSLEGLSLFVNLKWLRCRGNHIPAIPQLSDSLEALEVDGNQLSSVPLQQYPQLRRLSCGQNPIAWLDLDEMWNLRELVIRDTQVWELDARMTGIIRLDCGSNPFLSYVNIQNGRTWNSQKASAPPLKLDNLPSMGMICLDPGDLSWLGQSQWNVAQTNVFTGPDCSTIMGK